MSHIEQKSNSTRSEKHVKELFVYREKPPWLSVLITTAVMGVLITLVYAVNIPNPNMILIAGLVICSAVFGFWGGIPAAIIMLAYTLYFFSNRDALFVYTSENIAKVIVSVIGIVVDMLFVCILKRREAMAFREVKALTEELNQENMELQTVSTSDALTGIGNRLALRQKFSSYQHKKICVILLDVDDFKSVNDLYGHHIGDQMLIMTGSLLAEIFGADACFRYGGDEFLVIVPDPDLDDLLPKLQSILDRRPSFSQDQQTITISYSIGYQIGYTETPAAFRRLLSEADQRMYESKHNGKNQITGNR